MIDYNKMFLKFINYKLKMESEEFKLINLNKFEPSIKYQIILNSISVLKSITNLKTLTILFNIRNLIECIALFKKYKANGISKEKLDIYRFQKCFIETDLYSNFKDKEAYSESYKKLLKKFEICSLKINEVNENANINLVCKSNIPFLCKNNVKIEKIIKTNYKEMYDLYKLLSFCIHPNGLSNIDIDNIVESVNNMLNYIDNEVIKDDETELLYIDDIPNYYVEKANKFHYYYIKQEELLQKIIKLINENINCIYLSNFLINILFIFNDLNSDFIFKLKKVIYMNFKPIIELIVPFYIFYFTNEFRNKESYEIKELFDEYNKNNKLNYDKKEKIEKKVYKLFLTIHPNTKLKINDIKEKFKHPYGFILFEDKEFNDYKSLIEYFLNELNKKSPNILPRDIDFKEEFLKMYEVSNKLGHSNGYIYNCNNTIEFESFNSLFFIEISILAMLKTIINIEICNSNDKNKLVKLLNQYETIMIQKFELKFHEEK